MNNFKHWAIQKLLKWSHVLDVEKAVRDAYHKGIEATEKKYEDRVNVWWDPTVRAYPQPQKIVNPHGRYFKARHLEFMPEPVRTNTDPLDMEKDFPAFLNSVPIAVKDMTPEQIEKVPTKRDLTKGWDKDKTEERTAIDKLLYQGRQERQARQAG